MVRDAGAPALLPEGRAVQLPGRGVTFVHEEPGPPGAPVLMLLHGWTANAALNWFPTFAPLGRRFRVIALDHRGHGRGIRSRRPFRLEDCADDVAALAEVLGIERFFAVGYSMGGPIAALTWRRHREMVQGLVLCATAARFNEHPPNRLFLQGVVGLSLAAGLSPEAWRRKAMARFVGNRLDGTEHSRWSTAELARNDPASLLQAGVTLGGFDARSWFPTIDVPTAVVVPDDDQVVAPASQLAAAKAIPGAEVFAIVGDHGVCVGEPDRFVPVLMAACQSVVRRATDPRPVTT